MSSATEQVSTESLEEILQEVWSAYLAALEPEAPRPDERVHELTVTVAVRGAWNGYVELTFPQPAARLAAAAMLLFGADELSDRDVQDAIGELVNIVGGNVKSLLPSPTRLSLPAVTTRLEHDGDEGLRLLAEVAYGPSDTPVVARVWRATAVDGQEGQEGQQAQ